MRSIDLLCPCSTSNNTEDLNESSDNTLLEGINATLKEVANSIAESNTDVKNALNNLGKETQIENPQEESEENNYVKSKSDL